MVHWVPSGQVGQVGAEVSHDTQRLKRELEGEKPMLGIEAESKVFGSMVGEMEAARRCR